MSTQTLELVDEEAEFPEDLGLDKNRSDQLIHELYQLTKTDTEEKITTSWMLREGSKLAKNKVELAFIAYSVGVMKVVIGKHSQARKARVN